MRTQWLAQGNSPNVGGKGGPGQDLGQRGAGGQGEWNPFSWDGTPGGRGTSRIRVGEQDDPSSEYQRYALCPGSWHGLGELDSGVGAQVPGERREVRGDSVRGGPSRPSAGWVWTWEGWGLGGRAWLTTRGPGWAEAGWILGPQGGEGPPTHLSWNHSLGWEKSGLVLFPPTSFGQASLRYLLVSWVLSRWSCCRWSWGRGSTGPPGLISQPSGGSTGSRALRPSSHEPAPSS